MSIPLDFDPATGILFDRRDDHSLKQWRQFVDKIPFANGQTRHFDASVNWLDLMFECEVTVCEQGRYWVLEFPDPESKVEFQLAWLS